MNLVGLSAQSSFMEKCVGPHRSSCVPSDPQPLPHLLLPLPTLPLGISSSELLMSSLTFSFSEESLSVLLLIYFFHRLIASSLIIKFLRKSNAPKSARSYLHSVQGIRISRRQKTSSKSALCLRKKRGGAGG